MIRILHVFGQLNNGGAESRIMDLYRNIDRSLVQFDFVVHSENEGIFEKEILSLGGNIYRVPRFVLYNIYEYKKAWNKLIKHIMSHNETCIKMVHGHMTSTASIYLPIAKRNGVDVTIAHARSAGTDPGIKGFVTRILRHNLANKADYLFTCSHIAAVSAYGKNAVDAGKTVFVPNAINVADYIFDKEKRDSIRSKYGINDNQVVIGHVGRFHYAKNHEFLLAVFKELIELDREHDYRLLLLGDGPLMSEMLDLSDQLRIKEKVIFAGNQTDIYNYYNAMDYFVYPSRYEGLPGAVIEAQANGLSCLISDTICDEVDIANLIVWASINNKPLDWAKTVVYQLESGKKIERSIYAQKIADVGFDVIKQTEIMQKFYLEEILVD